MKLTSKRSSKRLCYLNSPSNKKGNELISACFREIKTKALAENIMDLGVWCGGSYNELIGGHYSCFDGKYWVKLCSSLDIMGKSIWFLNNCI